MKTVNLSVRAAAARSQFIAVEANVAKIGEAEVVAQCHGIVAELSLEERTEIAGMIRECNRRAQRCAVDMLKRMKLLALSLAVGGAKLNNGDAVALYQQHVGRADLPSWLHAVIQAKLEEAQASIEQARKAAEVMSKKPPTTAKPAQAQPRQAEKIMVAVPVSPPKSVVEAPKQKSRREKLEELLADMKNGSWVVRDLVEVLVGMSDNKRAKVAELVAQIEAEKGPCFLKVRDAVVSSLKKVGFHEAAKAIMEDCEEAEQRLVAVLEARPSGMPAWMRGPIMYRISQLRELAEKRHLSEANGIVQQWLDTVDTVQTTVKDAQQFPDLAGTLLDEVDRLFDEAVELRCEFWALEKLIEAGDPETAVGRKLRDDLDFAKKVHVVGLKKKAEKFRKLLFDTAFEAVERLEKMVELLPKVTPKKKVSGRPTLWGATSSNSSPCYEVVSGEGGRQL